MASAIPYDTIHGSHISPTRTSFVEVARMPTWDKKVQNFIYDNKEGDKDDNYQENYRPKFIQEEACWEKDRATVKQELLCHTHISDFIFAIIIEEYGLVGVPSSFCNSDIPVPEYPHIQKMSLCICAFLALGLLVLRW